jgi:hypothetical protein
MSYSVIEANGRYNVLEKESECVIQISERDETKARAVCRKLNLGSGFCGWTPEFLARKLFE